ncbi:MAG: thiamine pyrophosphate-binding protein [Alphaproteobacteria bacterium]|nr:thiamine pyrophosphate-binding protein [Alphaproteobacteria bacterium]MCY4229838.1 thiamine pyrophosphate-binding protein [Alphaproteobacteria bacterium]MCY4317821.1 thiamine pyrophosphate-binding protein [Alphaproteobacteria bacterium]
MTDSADLIAQRLAAAGCRHAFGIPGGEVIAILDALDRAGIRVLLARHENGAGFMGEGVHHSDGAPAILVATIGPGLSNATTVIANAFQDRVPMIVLTGCIPASEQHSYTHQIFDHVRLAETVAKAAFRVEDGMAGLLADRAVALATEGRPGPVLLDIPIDVQTREQSAPPPAPEAVAGPIGPAEGPALDKARAWLAAARRPLVIAGLDVTNQGAEGAVATFCHRFRAPLITTYKAKGVLPEDDLLALGGAGLSPRVDRRLLPLVAGSDCLVLAGYDPIEMRIGWRDPWATDARVIDLPAVAGGHGMHRAALLFPGDVAAGLEALGRGVSPCRTWSEGEPAATRAALRAESGLDEHWGPAAVIDMLRKVLPRDAVVTTDAGAHRIVLSQLYECYHPRGLLQSTGLCTMGGALPLAIGRKLAEPERAVVATMGDGGLEMVLGELATLRDLGLALPILVFADSQLGLIELKQRSLQLPNLAVDFGATDFPAVARALGGVGASVCDRASLARELDAALARDRFTVIAAEIGRRAYDGRI